MPLSPELTGFTAGESRYCRPWAGVGGGSIIGYLLLSERIRPPLIDWKDWLIRNNAAMISVLLVVFGTLIIGNGLKALSAS
jgi:hypothetical protein